MLSLSVYLLAFACVATTLGAALWPRKGKRRTAVFLIAGALSLLLGFVIFLSILIGGMDA